MAQKSTRQTEIELIKKLYELGGYFAAAFSASDIETMERNINADYDLLCSTTRDMSDETAKILLERNEAIDRANRIQQEFEILSESYDKVVEDREDVRGEFAAARDAWEKEAREYRLRINTLQMQIIRRNLMLKEPLDDAQANALIEMLDCYED